MRLETIISKALENLDGNNYLLAILVAKRSEQLSNGADNLIPDIVKKEKLIKPVDIAIYEIAENKLDYKVE